MFLSRYGFSDATSPAVVDLQGANSHESAPRAQRTLEDASLI